MTLAQWLKVNGWSGQRLADEVKVTRQAANKWIQGGRANPENAEKIEKLTNGEVTYRDLTKGSAA